MDTFDRPDHPGLNPKLGFVFCGVCGATVQDPDLDAMAAWSVEHAKTHSAEEHRQYAEEQEIPLPKGGESHGA